MRVLFLGNNRVGLQVARYLREQKETVVGAVLHPATRRKHGDEILGALDLHPGQIFDGSRLDDPEVVRAIAALEPGIGVSAFFGYILRPAMIGLFPEGCINLHPAYLPFNRGANPDVWSIVDGTPAGATLHYVDEGIDTGDIISQLQVVIDPADTSGSLYEKLEQACMQVFTRAWPMIREGTSPRVVQGESGSFHRTDDVKQIDEIRLDDEYRARELINVLRARTFPPHRGAYFKIGDRKVYLRLQLIDEDGIARESEERLS